MAKKKTKTTRKSTATKSKKVCRKTCAKKTRKSTTKKRVTRKSSNQFDWEIVPFVIAVVVAIIVVMQSMQSAEYFKNGGNSESLQGPLYHMAGGCVVDEGTVRRIRASERGISRAIKNGDSELAAKKIKELRKIKIEACL